MEASPSAPKDLHAGADSEVIGNHAPGREPGDFGQTPRLAEVWGDVVDLRHLGAAIAICCAISLAFFVASERLIVPAVQSSEIARTYSLVAGLAGCLTGGAVCAYLFRPKRIVAEQATDPAWQAEILRRIVVETGPLGSVASLPPATARELRELGLYELFRTGESMHAVDALPSTSRGEA